MKILNELNKIKNVVIIGGSGCIGTATCNYFTSLGISVTVIDIVPPENKDLKYIHCDIRNFKKLNEVLSGAEYVYILAAISDANENSNTPLKSMDINIGGINNVLIASRNNKVKRIIFSSTVWVYSECENTNVNENSTLPSNNVKHNYTASKIAGEMLIRSYSNLYNLDYTIMRYGIAYGPKTNSNTAISNFINKALNGESIYINGDGKAYRNFMYITDHARANLSVLHKNAINETINFDGPESVSIKKVAELVKNNINKKIKIKCIDSKPGDYKGKNVSNKKSLNLLGWEPKISFEDGLKKQIKILCQK